jgi:hypothetical protein
LGIYCYDGLGCCSWVGILVLGLLMKKA